ncbi:hypothetical protein IQ22_04608 [Pseudomonas duriflava]|uniref:Uncharacterized protein n=1 Tax=Pseudomonas duriflava TaxID=459528 RepID=A0A562PMM5_9PSED|nr:hypothetical protein IQ22_04608 [Pseudomonas duriflava]
MSRKTVNCLTFLVGAEQSDKSWGGERIVDERFFIPHFQVWKMPSWSESIPLGLK